MNRAMLKMIEVGLDEFLRIFTSALN